MKSILKMNYTDYTELWRILGDSFIYESSIRHPRSKGKVTMYPKIADSCKGVMSKGSYPGFHILTPDFNPRTSRSTRTRPLSTFNFHRRLVATPAVFDLMGP